MAGVVVVVRASLDVTHPFVAVLQPLRCSSAKSRSERLGSRDPTEKIGLWWLLI